MIFDCGPYPLLSGLPPMADRLGLCLIISICYIFKLYEEHREIGKYCGEKSKLVLTSESNSMYVEFTSDAILSGRGFEAEYYKVEGNIY